MKAKTTSLPIKYKTKYGLNDISRYLSKKYGYDQTLIKNVIKDFNQELARQLVLEGKCIKFPAGIGRFYIRRVKRDFSRMTIDWGETNKLKKKYLEEGHTLYSADNPDGKKYLVYFKDSEYLTFQWPSRFKRIINNRAYKLIPARTLKRLLNAHMREDELNIFKYEDGTDFFKYKRYFSKDNTGHRT